MRFHLAAALSSIVMLAVQSPALAEDASVTDAGTAGLEDVIGIEATVDGTEIVSATAEEAVTNAEDEGEAGVAEDDGPGESVVQVGESRTVEPGEVVDGDAVVVGGSLTIDGIVKGDAVCVGGTLRLGPTAVLEGDAVSVGGRAVIDPAATIRGDRVSVGVNLGPMQHLQKLKDAEEEDESGFLKRLLHFAWEIVFLVFLMFLALLLTVFMPRQTQRIEEHLSGDFPRTSLLGIGIMVLLPLVLMVMAVTLIGIPLIPLLLLAVGVTGVIGYLVFARVLGRRLAGDRHPMLQILVGLLLLQAASILGDLVALPGGAFEMFAHILKVVGAIIFLGGNFLGLGAVVYSRWGGRTLEETMAARSQNGQKK